MKKPNDPIGNRTRYFRLVVQCLNQIRNSNGNDDEDDDDDDDYDDDDDDDTFKSDNEYELVQFRNIIINAKLSSVLE
jgi:hypothetical protein